MKVKEKNLKLKLLTYYFSMRDFKNQILEYEKEWVWKYGEIQNYN